MTSTTRIPKAEITGSPVLEGYFAISGRAREWDACDASLKSFAHMAVASLVGCTFCLDYNYFQAHNQHLDLEKAREVPRWRESHVFTPLEREVLAYAEAMSQTPPAVTDEMFARLLDQLGGRALVELTADIALGVFNALRRFAPVCRGWVVGAACGLPPLAEPTARPGVP